MAQDIPQWKTHSSKITHKNNWFKVQTDQVTRPDGSKGEYNIVVSNPAVFIIAQDSDGDIYLIGQYRYTIGKYSIEIPAGSTDGKDPLEAAKRELKEETGLVAKKWEKLGSFYSANGLLSEKGHVYLATDLEQTNEHEQEDEGIDKLFKLSLDEVLKMIENGTIEDGQTYSSLMLLLIKKDFISTV